MAAISMDPPHMVCTGAACATCSNVAPGKLLRCSACHSAWYCNVDCQRAGFKEHKPFCKALRLFHALQADLPSESWPRTAQEFYVQRINCQQLLEPMLGRPLSRAEHRALLGEAKCSVCMRTRAQLARKAGASTPAAAGAAAATAATAPSGAVGAGGAGSDAAAKVKGKEGNASTGAGGEGKEGNGNVQHVDAAAKGAAAAPTSTTASPVAAAAAAAPAPAAAEPGLTCCPHCNWGWVCGEHREAYLSGPHAVVCLPYRNMNESQLLTQRYLTATGRVPNYVPDTPRRPAVLPPEAAKAVAAAAAAKAAAKGGAAAAAGGAAPAAGADASTSGSSGGWEPVPSGGWAAFQGWRPLPVLDQALMCLLTKRVSQALTVVQALQHHYSPQQLAARSSFEIHVLGASAFEVPADKIWEELLNLLPPFDPAAAAAAAIESLASPDDDDASVEGKGAGAKAKAAGARSGGGGCGTYTKAVPPRRLHVAFVGPELSDIIVDESDGRALPQGTALSTPAPPPGRELLYSYHLCTYQQYAAGRTPLSEAPGAPPPPASSAPAPWRRPDLAVAFNSGIRQSEQKLWAPALELLVAQGVPVVFTSYNAHEAEGDAAAWRAAGGVVTLGPERNPYRALEPIAEPSQVDVFYYQNYYWWCGRTKS
ncbi:hypothetical protein HYH02_002460 [Chlamydomonas schloesseri]|uniref:MYND-type domain-containing protein n=1 Tax=Chlamydomonas schloesseri TaxID=2026947 RepID=A0A835WS34_9CHLO|nr:hypothetical protein HYH02_002460 [Chlamydomonas schloesseri]|eukprot:KAG2453133.1 hypothetical protein HYH02_002460 [Chlamydomonas schloesseri]